MSLTQIYCQSILQTFARDVFCAHPRGLREQGSQGYTKHYYAGAERICSKIGGGGLGNIDSLAVAQDDLENKHASLKYHVRDVAECLGSPDYGFDTVFSELYYWKAIRENQETDG